MVRAPALFLVLLATAILVPSASADVFPGVSSGESVLLALDASSGELKPTKKRGRYVLRLNGLDRRALWFADRPARDAGQVATKRLFRSWKRLGFASEPPNAALAVTGARARRDIMAVELRLRSYNARRRSVAFNARRLGTLGTSLGHLNRRLDRRVTRRFGSASLFIDNVSEGQCAVGQPTLLARAGATAGQPVEDMIPADGRLLRISRNPELYAVYRTFYGGDGRETFRIPDLTAPVGDSGWYICTAGMFPVPENIGGECPVGEVDFFALPTLSSSSIDDRRWLPADGRTVPAASYPAYAAVYGPSSGSITLPSVSAPAGLTSYVCVQGANAAMPYLGELALYPPLPAGGPLASLWRAASGSALSVNSNPALAAVLDENSGRTFELPNVPATGATGAAWYIATQGIWPYG